MAVEIELELDASSALGEIGAVSLALENLDKKFEDLGDLELSLGEIGDEVRDLVSSLEQVDFSLNNISENINEAIKNLDGAEITANVSPDGSTGAGDSTGSDPPGGTPDGGGGSFLNAHRQRERFADLIGTDSNILPKEFINEMKEDFAGYAKGRTMHLPGDIKDRPYSDSFFQYQQGAYGTEPDSMREKRREELSDEERSDISSFSPGFGGDDGPSAFQQGKSLFDGDIKSNLESFENPLSGLTKRLQKLKPTMGKYMQLLAAIAPMMAAFGTQAAGVAVALGGVAAAGAAVMGLGLLGHANSMSGAFRQAKAEVKEFKGELFEVFQPAMLQFAPLQSQFFNWVPSQLHGIADALQGLTAYEDTFYKIFSTGVGAAEALVQTLVRNENIMSQMAVRSTQLVSSGLVQFLQWLVQTAYENWNVMMGLAGIFKDLLIILYQLSMFIARVVTNFQPFFDILVKITSLLNNDVAAGVLTMIALMYGLQKAAMLGAGALAMLTGNVALFGGSSLIASVVGGIARITGMLYGLVAAAWEANMALGILAGLATGGLALGAMYVGAKAIEDMATGGSGPATGGGSGPGVAGGGQKVVYNDNRSYSFKSKGNMDSSTEERMKDAIKEHDGTVKSMDAPSPTTNTSSSSTGDNNGGSN